MPDTCWRLTVYESVNDVLSVLLHEVVDVAEDSTVVAISCNPGEYESRLISYHMLAACDRWQEGYQNTYK